MNNNKPVIFTLPAASLHRSQDPDSRTLEGIAVPFGQVIDTWTGQETFDKDSQIDTEGAKLAYEHSEIIGTITNTQPQEDGLHITAKVADTQRGNDCLALIDAGALDSFSVGFLPIEDDRDEHGITHRRHVRLLETSVVSFPAYSKAKITDRRNTEQTNQPTGKEQTPMPAHTALDDLKDQIAAFAEEQRTLKAAIGRLNPTQPAAVIGAAYRNSAEFLKGLAKGDEDAVNLINQTRDLISSADTGNIDTWIQDDLHLVESRRTIMNLVTRAALPPDGLKVDYNVITSDATTVAKQAKEGDALKFGKISFGTKSAQIETYGGYTTLSRQVIERATTPMLETALKALKIAYARSTELAVRADLYGLIDSESKANNKIAAGKTVDKLTVADWVSILVDASEIMDERDYGMSALGVSKDVFKALAALADPGDRFMDLSGKGANTLGSLEVTGVQGDLMHIPVRLLPSAPAGTASIINPEAVTAWEAGGPFQLTDTDPTKLTDNYSVYGYMAVGDTAPQAILPITMIAA